MTTINNDKSVDVTLVARCGDTYERNFTVKNNDGSPYDFTGYAARLQIKVNQADLTEILELSTDNAGIVLTSGNLNLNIPKATTEDITPRSYYYDLEVTYPAPASTVRTWLSGRFIFNQDVTR